MAEYVAPIKDMQFVLKHVVGLDQVNTLPGWEEVTEDVVDAILEEAGKLASEVLSPLNATGDRTGARWKDGEVTTPPDPAKPRDADSIDLNQPLPGQTTPAITGTAAHNASLNTMP